jgi:hypothetical protein
MNRFLLTVFLAAAPVCGEAAAQEPEAGKTARPRLHYVGRSLVFSFSDVATSYDYARRDNETLELRTGIAVGASGETESTYASVPVQTRIYILRYLYCGAGASVGWYRSAGVAVGLNAGAGIAYDFRSGFSLSAGVLMHWNMFAARRPTQTQWGVIMHDQSFRQTGAHISAGYRF